LFQAGALFLRSSGVNRVPKVFLNGYPIEDSAVIESVRRFTAVRVCFISRFQGKLKDRMDVQQYLLSKPDVMPKLNFRILSSNPWCLDLTDINEYEIKGLKEFDLLTKQQRSQYIIQKMSYLVKNDEPVLRPVTMWLVIDVETEKGRNVLRTALLHLVWAIISISNYKHSQVTRIGIIHSLSEMHAESKLALAIQGCLNLLNLYQAKLVLQNLLDAKIKNWSDLDVAKIHGVDWAAFKTEVSLMANDVLSIHARFVASVLNFQPGQMGIISNGQVFGPFDENESFDLQDFDLLEKYTLSRGAELVAEHLETSRSLGRKGRPGDMVMRVVSLVLGRGGLHRRHKVMVDEMKHSGVFVPAPKSDASKIDIVAIIDPLSRHSQKLSALLSVLTSVVNSDVGVIMNCKPKLSAMPLKSFFRFVLPFELEFLDDGSIKAGSYARFSNLPSKQLLTLNVIPPDPWLVEAVDATVKAVSDVIARYELEYLLLEGHCFDEASGGPPRGLQFVLGTSLSPNMVDTIVMANLGYFQLKANPGVWSLSLREGKSSDIYQITTHENTDSSFHQENVTIVISSFSGKIIKIKVSKKPDKLGEDLLSDADDQDGKSIWQSLSNTFSGNAAEKENTINIFSLASGHLYERFIRIMMVSVMKHTKSPVQFWLLKNYLSPNFKVSAFLPHMAKHYNFSYELVQYKWPRWLHQQSEKHRVMWGYKILFLDVLFPLDVRKIIFVDADQVVRADMLELMRFDLEGAPYGYTPFCDSRKEMDGYRFWKHGYWANHLAGRKYHISALYVVDLKKFRRVAAGDRLRGQYQGLSSDPNSLSNLDQDLPNNMIHQVKVKSLPQDWLWCETWCDDKSKKYAKTIDLCNNPMTKEPKLDSAIRIIEEWRDYDEEIRRLKNRYEEKQSVASKQLLEKDGSANAKERTY
uniref:Glyco_transf_24 domain-containing protein n=1 Tax=Soboliphyme baturini TaxID=241478 RepID=A0A183IHE1_9BILA